MIRLYSYFRSSCSYRVRIVLNLKGLDYEIVPVHLMKGGGEQFSSEFTVLNGANRIPVLEHDGKRIAQSVAICRYLDEVFKERPLYPKNPHEGALCQELVEIINADIQPMQNLSVLKKLTTAHQFSEEDKLQWIQYWISRGFQSYEALALKTAGKFSLGDQLSLADCFLIPQIYNGLRFGVEIKNFPTLERINQVCLEDPAFIKAHPSNQPDTPAGSSS